MPPRLDRQTRSRENSPASKAAKPRKQSDEELMNFINSTEDLSEVADGAQATTILQLLRFIANTQQDLVKSMNSTKSDIAVLQTENVALKSRISVLEEDTLRIDQYSRKGVMTITGLMFDPTASQANLESEVLGMLNQICSSFNPLNRLDFVAIHRNSKEGRNGRPPTITAKFIRFNDKNRYFSKTARSIRKTAFPGVGFHHNMCQALINEQKEIENHVSVKWASYMGDNRGFSVCLTDGSFLNFIRSYKHFKTSLDDAKAGS